MYRASFAAANSLQLSFPTLRGPPKVFPMFTKMRNHHARGSPPKSQYSGRVNSRLMHGRSKQGQTKTQSLYVEERELSYRVGPCIQCCSTLVSLMGYQKEGIQRAARFSISQQLWLSFQLDSLGVLYASRYFALYHLSTSQAEAKSKPGNAQRTPSCNRGTFPHMRMDGKV